MKKETKATKIMKYLHRRPNEKASVIAKATGVSIQTVYQVKHMRKKEGKLPSTTAPNARKSLALFSGSPKNEKLIMTHDNVNHPAHYKTGGIETIDFIEAKSLSYNLGNVVKYITRADHKGNKLEDLKKAQWYLNREVSNLGK
jgi:hypothetical protein